MVSLLGIRFYLLFNGFNKQAVQNYSKCLPSTPRSLPTPTIASTPHSPSGDAVLITKADLEGYHNMCNAGMELAIVPKLPKAKPMIARLSCLFASLKVSGTSVPSSRRLPVSEARAC